MASFDEAVELVFDHEGGYTAGLPGDPGGETNFGISKRAFPELDIKNLSRDDAKALYHRVYWTGYMEKAEQEVGNCLLDCAVNQGPAVARAIAESRTGASLKAIQVQRLLKYAALDKPQFYHSWFTRTLDV